MRDNPSQYEAIPFTGMVAVYSIPAKRAGTKYPPNLAPSLRLEQRGAERRSCELRRGLHRLPELLLGSTTYGKA